MIKQGQWEALDAQGIGQNADVPPDADTGQCQLLGQGGLDLFFPKDAEGDLVALQAAANFDINFREQQRMLAVIENFAVGQGCLCLAEIFCGIPAPLAKIGRQHLGFQDLPDRFGKDFIDMTAQNQRDVFRQRFRCGFVPFRQVSFHGQAEPIETIGRQGQQIG